MRPVKGETPQAAPGTGMLPVTGESTGGLAAAAGIVLVAAGAGMAMAGRAAHRRGARHARR